VPKWLKIEPTRHQVAIAGRVTDARTGKPIGGARVEIVGAPPEFTAWLAIQARRHGTRWAGMAERPDRTRTAADGHFHFLDLPDGDYTLIASLPGSGTRYDTAQADARVSRDAGGNIAMATANVALPPTALEGSITDQATGDPVAMAEVRVKGSGECTFSEARDETRGRYLLVGLEAGERTIVVSAQGYGTVTRTAPLSRGDTAKLDVAL
jgi:hypothetical protein